MRRHCRWRSFEQDSLDSVQSQDRLEEVYLPPLRKPCVGPTTHRINPFIRRIRAALRHPNCRKHSWHINTTHNFSNSDLAEASLREGLKGMNHPLKLQIRPHKWGGIQHKRTNSTLKIEVYLGRPKEMRGWEQHSMISRETSMDC